MRCCCYIREVLLEHQLGVKSHRKIPYVAAPQLLRTVDGNDGGRGYSRGFPEKRIASHFVGFI